MRATPGLLLALLAVPASADTEWSRFPAIGTSVEIAVRHADEATRRAALDAARLVFERHGRAWYPWHEGGELYRLNTALANGEAARVSPELADLLQQARHLSCLSEGRFDPAIGGLVELWGFHRPPPYTDPPPAGAEIDRWLAADADIGDLRFADGSVASTNSAVQLDLGGIAKGALIDRALAAIREAGVKNALVNAGGDLAVIGTAEDRRWRTGIRDPAGEGPADLLGSIALQPGEALFTSGDYERYRVTSDGRRLGHVLDPGTGRPVREAVQASVIADSGTVADAAATALMAADAETWSRIAAAMGVDHVLWIGARHQPNADPGFARRFEPAGKNGPLHENRLPSATPRSCGS